MTSTPLLTYYYYRYCYYYCYYYITTTTTTTTTTTITYQPPCHHQVSACKSLVVLASNDYTKNLRCVLEIFCFLAMGGAVSDIIVLDAYGGASDASASNSRISHRSGRLNVRSLFRAPLSPRNGQAAAAPFWLDGAAGESEEETERLMSVIEATYGDAALFDAEMKGLFSSCHATRRWSVEFALPRHHEARVVAGEGEELNSPNLISRER